MKTYKHSRHNGGSRTAVAKRVALGRRNAVEGVKDVQRLANQSPLQTLAIVVGLGALMGFLAGRRFSRPT